MMKQESFKTVLCSVLDDHDCVYVASLDLECLFSDPAVVDVGVKHVSLKFSCFHSHLTFQCLFAT